MIGSGKLFKFSRIYECLMKKHILYCLFMTILVPGSYAQQFSEADKILKAYTGENTPGASLAVIKEGKIIYQKTYGLADLEKQVKVTPEHNFRLASVTKQFTATAVLLLIQRGKFTLDHTLTDIFDGFPAYGKNITVRHLLNHTSGIEDYEDYVADTAVVNQIKDQGVLDIVKKLDKGYFAPGSQYRYSNTAYALLALIIEKYSGKSYAAFLNASIFKPLGMKNTVAYEKGISEVKHRAYGYSKNKEDQWVRRDQSSTSAVLGDGGIYSSTNDLYLWDQSLYTDKILPNGVIQLAFSPNKTNDGKVVDYGFGWHLTNTKKGEKVVYHTGSTTSFRNVFYRIPASEFSIILLTNRNKPDENNMLGLAEKLAEAFGY